MGGDNVITHELSDRFTEEFGGHRFKALAESLPSSRICSEWVSTIFRLYSEQPERMQDVNMGDLLAYAALESHRMEQLDWLDQVDISDLSDEAILKLVTPSREMYYAHSGVNSMLHRQDRLRASAEILERAERIASTPNHFMKRQIANMYEELAFYGMFSGDGAQERERAARLNAAIIQSNLDWHFPYKSHAEFSMFDLKSLEILSNPQVRAGEESPFHALRELQVGYHRALSSFCDEIVKQHDSINSMLPTIPTEFQYQYLDFSNGCLGTMAGVAAEGLVLAIGRDYILESGKHNSYWMKQAAMRQDAMGGFYPDGNEESEKIVIPNLTFDLTVFNYHDVDERLNIEVKKRRGVAETSILPGIEVVSIRNGSSPHVFAKLVKNYCEGQIVAFSQNKIKKSKQHKKAREFFHNAVNPGRLIPGN